MHEIEYAKSKHAVCCSVLDAEERGHLWTVEASIVVANQSSDHACTCSCTYLRCAETERDILLSAIVIHACQLASLLAGPIDPEPDLEAPLLWLLHICTEIILSNLLCKFRKRPMCAGNMTEIRVTANS